LTPPDPEAFRGCVLIQVIHWFRLLLGARPSLPGGTMYPAACRASTAVEG
jgi:hypothetical protein